VFDLGDTCMLYSLDPFSHFHIFKVKILKKTAFQGMGFSFLESHFNGYAFLLLLFYLFYLRDQMGYNSKN